MATLSATRAGTIWRLLVALDAVIVTTFAITASAEPYHVLEGNGIEIPGFQGLLPTVIVLALRAMVLAVERRLLPVARGGLVAATRLASLVGFYYLGHWLYHEAYGRWWEVVLGGTLGYALVGVAATGLAGVLYNLARFRMARTSAPVPTPEADQIAPPVAAEPPASTAPRREITRESLLGLIGVFQGVTGLALGVTNLSRVAIAVFIGMIAVAAVSLLLYRRAN